MTTTEQIRVLCVRTGVSLSELARRINQSPQNFNAKLKRNTVTRDELIEIANALKCDIGDLVRMDDSTILKNQD